MSIRRLRTATENLMQVFYTKMQGAGNLILVVDQRDGGLSPPPAEIIRQWGNEATGPGFDQLMWLSSPGDSGAVARYRVFNTDGSEVEQCGNGVRCVARFLSNGNEPEVRLQGPSGPVVASMRDDQHIAVSMGRPDFEPSSVPFHAPARAPSYRLELGGGTADISVVSMGNPHCVLQVDDVERAPVSEVGREIESHPRFPERTNVGFMQIVDRSRIALRVFERGVGETLACGTGACAAVVIGQQLKLLDDDVDVALPGGKLMVSWRRAEDPVWLTGGAERISEGMIEL